jgi:hypothetical protein
VVKPGKFHLMKKVYGINWKANVNTAWHVIKACGGKYTSFGTFVEVIDAYLAILECVNNVWMLSASFALSS